MCGALPLEAAAVAWVAFLRRVLQLLQRRQAALLLSPARHRKRFHKKLSVAVAEGRCDANVRPGGAAVLEWCVGGEGAALWLTPAARGVALSTEHGRGVVWRLLFRCCKCWHV
ncbi:hypothetical protein STCU_11273 [Strigomonas culicis]|uniref:Uncharacterized protein n=1 Tax=Strigomonas culicis TaxID=28005 RepID=S9UP18_9TRYP|nr:hypothetical protein STCU_11273 [Strigomonas culicis]|eukprot:EPY16436.1 hypothetical protein STCU_11273 [Strigomonas culicis]